MEFKKFASVDMRKRGISEASIESLIADQPELLGLGDDIVLVRVGRHPCWRLAPSVASLD